MTSEQKISQETHRAIELATSIAGSIPEGTPTYVVTAALAQVVAASTAFAAEGDRDRALERLARFNRLVETLTIDQCLHFMERGEG